MGRQLFLPLLTPSNVIPVCVYFVHLYTSFYQNSLCFLETLS